MRILSTLLLVILSVFVHAQIKTELSPAIDIPEQGWNKTIMMRNGNTLLFHFQYHRKVTIKVFDSSRNEIATSRPKFRMAGVNEIQESYFDGLFDVSGEAVLFITQNYNNKQSLIRLRFNANDGSLIGEDVIVQSRGLMRETSSWVAKQPRSDNYFVVSLVDDIYHRTEKLVLDCFNSKHELTKTMPYDIDKHTYYKVILKDWNFSKDGHLLFSIKLLKKDSVNEHISYSYLGLFYLPNGYKDLVTKIIELPKKMVLMSTDISYNPFSRFWNIMLSYLWDPSSGKYLLKPNQLVLIYDESLKFLKQEELSYSALNTKLQDITDSTHHFIGDVSSFYTSEYGITSVIKSDDKTNIRSNKSSCDSNSYYIGITHLNEGMEEIGAVVLKKACLNSYIYRHAYDLSGPVFYYKTIIRDASNYFVIEDKGNYSLLYNDRNANFNLDASKDKMYEIMSFDSTNAMCVTINRKREVKKEYIFKPMLPNVYTTLLGGTDYDSHKRIYSGVVRRVTDTSRTLHLAWIEFK